MKIYTDDPAVPCNAAVLSPSQTNPRTTKLEIEGVLARWGIKKSGWEWDLDADKCVLEFQYLEKVNDVDVAQWVRIEPPRIWTRPKKNSHGKSVSQENINWATSLRVLYWWLKTHLEMTYLEQFDMTTMMLPFIQNANGQTLAQILVPKLTRQLLEVLSLEDLR